MAPNSPARELRARLFALGAEIKFRALQGREPAAEIIGGTIAALEKIRAEYDAAQAREVCRHDRSARRAT